MEREDFRQLIVNAIAMVPERIRSKINNVVFLVEEAERRPRRGERGIRHAHLLLGLYHGIPLLKRHQGYSMVVPDTITIFQHPIEELAGDDRVRVKALVTETVLHEIAHHLGFDEREVRQWERKRKTGRKKGI